MLIQCSRNSLTKKLVLKLSFANLLMTVLSEVLKQLATNKNKFPTPLNAIYYHTDDVANGFGPH